MLYGDEFRYRISEQFTDFVIARHERASDTTRIQYFITERSQVENIRMINVLIGGGRDKAKIFCLLLYWRN